MPAQNVIPEVLPKPNAVLERQLNVLWPLVQLITRERYELLQEGEPATDSTYDRFLWEHVGRPDDGERGSIKRLAPAGESYTYDDAVSVSYSPKGSMAVVRRSTGKHSMDNNRYLVVTADLPRRNVTEWHITNIELSGRLGSLCTTLVLSERYLHPVPDDMPTDLEETFPRFELSGHGNVFYDQYAKRHVLAPITELCQVVEYAWPAIRQAPQVIENQTAEQTIAKLQGRAA